MASATLTAPLDVLKTRLQSDFYQSQLSRARTARGVPPLHSLGPIRSSLLHIRETLQILVAVPRVEGPRALFKGLGPSLVGVVPARAINFFAYGNGKRVISQRFFDGQEKSIVHLLAAAQAGVVTGTATCPVWVVKTRLQLDRNLAAERGAGRRYKNAVDCAVQTVRQEGVRGLYRGLGASYLGVTESTMQWVLYEKLKSVAGSRERAQQARGGATGSEEAVNWGLKISAAGTAKFVAAIVTYPHEVIRTRLRQAPESSTGRVKYTGIAQCASLVWKEEGVAALYGGLVPHMMRVVPSAAIMFGCYEAILKVLGTDSGV